MCDCAIRCDPYPYPPTVREDTDKDLGIQIFIQSEYKLLTILVIHP